MRSQAKINVETVIKYLAINSSISNGLTGDEIAAATGISRSSVYRIIQKHPAIVHLEFPGKRMRVYLDQEKMIESMAPKPKDDDGRMPLIKADPEWVASIQQMNAEQFSRAMRKFDHGADKAALKDAMMLSYSFQSGADSIDADTMKQARVAIDHMLEYSAMLIAYLRMVKQHPEYLSDTEWWAIWPKD